MKITSQAEWDALPEKFDKFLILEIQTDGKTIKIKSNPGKSSTILYGKSSAELRGNFHAALYENSMRIRGGIRKIKKERGK